MVPTRVATFLNSIMDSIKTFLDKITTSIRSHKIISIGVATLFIMACVVVILVRSIPGGAPPGPPPPRGGILPGSLTGLGVSLVTS